MNKDQKAALVEELVGQLQGADAVFAVDYRGISVSEAADLRSRLRDAETVFRVVKNSLTERASDQAGTEALKPLLEGPTALAFVSGDAALAAKALNDAARTLGTLEFKGGLLNGAPLTSEEVQRIARLPAREVLHSQLVGTIASPLSGLVRTLNALIAGLAVQLGQIAEQGLVSGEAAPPSEAPRASDTEGEVAASDASASDAGDASPETEATATDSEPEGQAEAAPSEPEAEAPAEPEAEEEPEAEAAPVETKGEQPAEPEAEAPSAAEAEEAPQEPEQPETEASDAQASEE